MASNNAEIDLVSLQKEAEFYRNLIKQHESKQKLSMESVPSKKVQTVADVSKTINPKNCSKPIATNIKEFKSPQQLISTTESKQKLSMESVPSRNVQTVDVSKTLNPKNSSKPIATNIKKFESPQRLIVKTNSNFKTRTVIFNNSKGQASSISAFPKSDSFACATSKLPLVRKNTSAKCGSSIPDMTILQSSTNTSCDPGHLFTTPLGNSVLCNENPKQKLALQKQKALKEIVAMTNKLKQASKTMMPQLIIGKSISYPASVLSSSSLQKQDAKKPFISSSFSKSNLISMVKASSNKGSSLHSLPSMLTPKNTVKYHTDNLNLHVNDFNIKRKVFTAEDFRLEKSSHSTSSAQITTAKTPITIQTAIPSKTLMSIQKDNLPKPLVSSQKVLPPERLVMVKKALPAKTPFCIQRSLSARTPVSVKKYLAAKAHVDVQKNVSGKTPVNARLISSKFKLVNKNSNEHSLAVKQSPVKPMNCISSTSNNKDKVKLNTKYKLVNKNSPVRLKINSLKITPPKSLKLRKTVFISKNQKVKINKFVTPGKQIANRHCKSHQVTKPVSKTPKLSKRSRYKVINKASVVHSKKNTQVIKLGSSNKVFKFSSDMDVDLLMELAAEKKSPSVATSKPQKVLMKRVYKTKNMLINKNVSSPQIKTAQMIKTKYLAPNRKHVWLKQGRPRKFLNNHFAGTLKRQPTKFYSPFAHSLKRNSIKYKNYPSHVYCSKNLKRMHYSQYKSNYASKSLRRISGKHSFYKKNVKNISSTPVSKILASRVLQHSISRALTLSSKKKTSKLNTYCMFYNRFGRCNKGTNCKYVHDPSKIAICTRFLRGTCKADNCPFSHEVCPGKMAICSFFLSDSCTKTNCPYRHEKLKPGAELCKAFVKGYCPKGKQCQKAHVLICPDYVQGSCNKGHACAFPHPPPKEKKANEKVTEKQEDKDSDELLMERVSRYFEPSNGEPQSKEQYSTNSVVPQRKMLPEQPSFISLSISDNDS